VSERHTINRKSLAAISLAIALICAGALALLVRDRWNRPEIKTAAEARYTTTGQVARSVGARISQTDPKLAVEPAPPGPKPAQPANPN
jgi:Flp pilus assembly protein CpaB